MPQLCLPHEYARQNLEAAYQHWLDSLGSLLSNDLEDEGASRAMLLATHQLETQRRVYDMTMMLMLPPQDLWAKAYDHEWRNWLSWNKRLSGCETLLRLTRPGGGLDLVWKIGGKKLLA